MNATFISLEDAREIITVIKPSSVSDDKLPPIDRSAETLYNLSFTHDLVLAPCGKKWWAVGKNTKITL